MSIRFRIGGMLLCVICCSFTAGAIVATGGDWFLVWINAAVVALNVVNLPIPNEAGPDAKEQR